MTNVVAIAAGENHDLLLHGDGTLTGWGWNGFGQTNVPPGTTNVIAVAAGGDDSLALMANGRLIAWGRNDFFQTNVPAGLSNVTAISAGNDHNLALTRLGTVAAWGSNLTGQTNVPAAISNVVAMAAGKNGSLVLTGAAPASLSLTHPLRNQGVFSVSAATARGTTYRLEFKGSLTDTNWKMLPPMPGDGTNKTLTDSTATAPQRFYRVRQY
jgi:hypothetical protein